MPKGHHIPDMMENEVARLFYACLKHHEGSIDFQAVATMLGFKDAAFAKERLRRVMRAQGKTTTRSGYGGADDKKATRAAGERGRPAKKRKTDKDAEQQDESHGEAEDEEAAMQLHESLFNLDKEEEKVGGRKRQKRKEGNESN